MRHKSAVDPASYLTRFEALQRQIRAKQHEMRADPENLVLQTQLRLLQRRARWYERRAPGTRHNIEVRSTGGTGKPRQRVTVSDAPL